MRVPLRVLTMTHDPHSDPQPTLDQAEVPALSEEVQQQIGRKLRLLYEQLEAEPIPDRFVELLRALAEKESKPT
ncbi:hypothetical protein SAMN05519104_1532 [Rhizobiales bacterium GAS188]|nr:hypothetical protein SAMN05519104_1532 [Rhizobiales bacterium GAS188]